MHTLIFIAGLLLILATLLDGFETILLPRRINRRLRYSHLYYRGGWFLWRRMATLIPRRRLREAMLGVFGPLSMLGLFASWIIVFIFSFGVLYWAMAAKVLINGQPHEWSNFATYLYLSGTTYFTLGLGDITPAGGVARFLTVAESGLGLGFLAIIISYLPVIYQAFSRREVTISLMDARAGSPPRAGEFVVRLASGGHLDAAGELLREWEHWCAELLESHISFPVLGYFRSQHGNQSWLSSLAMILDTCALLLTLPRSGDLYRVELTFAMARHALVDIALIFNLTPTDAAPDRLTAQDMNRLLGLLPRDGTFARESDQLPERLSQLRAMYEPILAAAAAHFALTVPSMIAPEPAADNWQRSPWMPRTPGIGNLPAASAKGDHFG